MGCVCARARMCVSVDTEQQEKCSWNSCLAVCVRVCVMKWKMRMCAIAQIRLSRDDFAYRRTVATFTTILTILSSKQLVNSLHFRCILLQ